MGSVGGQGLPPEFSVVHASADSHLAEGLTRFLTNAGFAFQRAGSTADVAVVLLSRTASSDPSWTRQVESVAAGRIIPVRIDDVASGELPDVLQPIQWLQWNHASPVTTWGAVAGALQSSPLRVLAAAELRRAAHVWVDADRDGALLVDSYRRAQELQQLLLTLDDDPLAVPDEAMRSYVDLSSAHARKRRQWRRARFGLVTVVILAAVSAFIEALPAVRENRRVNRAAIVTSGDPQIVEALPEWSALLSGYILVFGTDAQRALARTTLRNGFSRPWSLGSIVPGKGYAVEAVQPVDADNAVAVIRRAADDDSTFVVQYRLSDGSFRAVHELQGSYYYLDAARDRAVVAVAGPSGVATVDFATGAVRALDTVRSTTVRIMPGAAISVTGDHRVRRLPSDGSDASEIADYESLLDLRVSDQGELRALVKDGPGAFSIVNVLTGQRLAAMTGPDPVISAGGLATNEVLAYVVGPGRELWTLTPAGGERTGVAVPDRTEKVLALPGDRAVFGGQVESVQVVHVPSATPLGVVCRELVRAWLIAASPNGQRLACVSQQSNDFWRTPAGPLVGGDGTRDAEVTAVAGGSTVRGQGGDLVLGDGPTAASATVFTTDIAAIALSPSGDRAVAVAESGDTAIVDLSPGRPVVAVRWNLPSGASGSGARWADGPIASGSDEPRVACPGLRTLWDRRRAGSGAPTAGAALLERPTAPGCR